MYYREARDAIRDGDIIAVRGTSLLSRLIEAATGGPWSHVGVAWWLEDRLMVAQQREVVGCQIVPVSRLLPFDWISTGVTLTARARSRAFRDLGRSYSYLDALRVGIGLRAMHRDRVCSTFATTILGLCGRGLPTLERQSPAALVQALLDAGCALTSIERSVTK